MTTKQIPRPFIKWVGGKSKLLPALLSRMPGTLEGRYIEPFVGGGALFFHLKPANAWLNDINEDLISTYEWIKTYPNMILYHLKEMAESHSKEQFLNVRDNIDYEPDTCVAAARFLYLNKTCFNGLYRVNSKGQFNVPYGGEKAYSAIVDEPNLVACSQALQGVRLTSMDFREVIREAGPGDFVYADPPYIPVKKGSFTKYAKGDFGLDDHRALSDALWAAKARGARILASNSNCLETYEIYTNFRIEQIDSIHMVNCKGDGRKPIKEVIIR